MKRFVMAALLLAAFAVQAADDGASRWQIGAGAAFGDFKTDDEGIDDAQVGFQLSAQYKFNSWFGIEGTYYNSSDFEKTLVPGDSDTLAQISFRGFGISGVGYLPLGDAIDVYGKVGFFDFNTDLAIGGSVASSSNTHGASLGGGALIHISDNLGIKAELNWYDVDESELWDVVLGLEYMF